MDSLRAETYVLDLLRRHLSPTLYYHGLHHTLDVAEQAASLAAGEGITNPEELTLLRTAALYHDTGFMTVYQGHEAVGCALVREVLPEMGYSEAQVALICQLIMATRMPQNPGALLLARILCDADLHYLGRPDFWPVSTTLRREWAQRGAAFDDQTWYRNQVAFLSAHHYWTPTAIARCEAGKQAHLAEARERAASSVQ